MACPRARPPLGELSGLCQAPLPEPSPPASPFSDSAGVSPAENKRTDLPCSRRRPSLPEPSERGAAGSEARLLVPAAQASADEGQGKQ